MLLHDTTLNADDVVDEMPEGYRWATADEVENYRGLPENDIIRVNLHESMVQVRSGMPNFTSYARKWDCLNEFGEHEHDPEECERIIAGMDSDEYYDDRDYSGWYGEERGYQDGLRWSDFV